MKMKKYLMTGIAALALCVGFTSCSHDLEVNQDKIDQINAEKIVKDYQAAFIKTFGQPSADQTWGFDATASMARTRGDGAGTVIKPDNGQNGIFIFTNDEKNASNFRSPQGVAKYVAPITKKEAEWVQDYFDKHPGLTDEAFDFENFYVQQINNKLCSADEDNKNGYSWIMQNGSEVQTEKSFKVKMDQLRIGSERTESNTVHINDFNATNGFNEWGAIYVQNGSSKQFGYYASYGSQWQWKFQAVELEVPGTCFEDGQPRVGYYVGLSYYCDKVEVAGEKGERIGEDEINIANDWILKIVPGEISDPKNIRVFAEDLSASEASDFDFNDVVFDAKYLNASQAEITLWAAGGTLPLTVCDVEVHEKFGVDVKTMVNTHAEPYAKGEYKWVDNKPAQVFTFTLPTGSSFDSDTYKDNFALAVRDLIQVKVFKNDQWIELKANKGEAACKIATPVKKVKWVKEKVALTSGYPTFATYVRYPVTKWWNPANEPALYPVDGNSTTCKDCQ
jgi:hypothetical protein